MQEINICLLTDSYKQTHKDQYPPGTTKVYSYFESRGGEYDETVFFGLQYIIKKYLAGQVVTQEKIDEAEEIVNAHFGAKVFNRADWEYILEKYNGHLPLKIMAVPEGTVVGTKNVLFTIENTDPRLFWLTNFAETLLVQCWYPCTVATQSRVIKTIIAKYLIATGCSLDDLNFKLHDFGFRGVSSVESAGIGGCAHLVIFEGTDTIQALVIAKEYYGCPMAGFSIPASEHSTMTAWGKEGEVDAYRNMLKIYKDKTFACVSDSYSIINACENIWGGELKEEVLKHNGVLVVRPDSGPVLIVPKDAVMALIKKFGGKETGTGHMLLNPKVRTIQGDGMNKTKIEKLLRSFCDQGVATGNIGFGMGGGLLQNTNRDTSKYAMKCSHVIINGVGRDVWKDPVTDPGKKSKRGRLQLIKTVNDGKVEYKTINESSYYENELKLVFLNGELLINQTLDEIRKRAQIELS